MRLLSCLALGVLMLLHPVFVLAATNATLVNGMKVLIHEDSRFPLVSLRLSIKVGSAYEDPKTAGISHLLEHMVFKRTKKWPTGTAAKKVEEMGGYINAATSFDYTTYIVDMPSDQWELGMEVLEQLVFGAVFDKEELEREKEVVLEELRRGQDNPHNTIFQKTQALLFKGTGYQRPIIGYEDTIKAITVNDLQNYIAKYYQPQAMYITVVGDINKQNIFSNIQSRFLEYKNTLTLSTLEPIEPKTLPYGQFISIERSALNKVYLALTMPLPGYYSIESTQLSVLAQLLAGDLVAPLQKKYKYDLQLVDSLSVNAYAFQQLGMLYITAEIDPDKTEAFLTELTKDLILLPSMQFGQENITKVLFQVEDSFLRAKETLSSLTSFLNYLQLTSPSPLAAKNYLDTIRGVDQNTLSLLAKNWITPNQLSLVALIPSKSPKIDFQSILKKNFPITAKNEGIQSEIISKEPKIVTLEDGKTIIFTEDTTIPYTSISIKYQGGELLTKEDKQGLIALTSQMLLMGTKKRSALEIEQFQSTRSASLSASSGKTSFTISATQPAQFTNDILPLLKEIITEPTFPKNELEKEKNNQIAAITSTEDRAFSLLFRRLGAFLFPNQQYGYYTLGTKESIQNIKKEDLITFWNEQKTKNMVFSVTGVYDEKDIIEFVKELPSPSKEENKRTVLAPSVTWNTVHENLLILPQREQSHILLTYPTAPIASEDTAALCLLEASLSGLSGMLFIELREKRSLAYTVRSFNSQNTVFGMYSFYIASSPDKQDNAIRGFEDIIQSLINTPLPKDDIEKGKRQIKSDYYRSVQSYSARAASNAQNYLLQLPLSYDFDMIQKVESLTAKDLQNVVKKYFANTKPYLSIVQP
ncbi:MAG: M16 family metallopeptidase [Desulfovibrionaceae bacterium]